jgi:hypothetical protein
MKSLLRNALFALASVWITACSVEQETTLEEETQTTSASVVAREEDEPSVPPPPTNKKAKLCPHDTPNEGAACNTSGSCYYAVEQTTYPLVTLVECRCIGSAWACFP